MPLKRGEWRVTAQDILEKRCTHCGRWFEASENNFAPNNYGLFNLRPDCRECCANRERNISPSRKAAKYKRQVDYRKANREAINARQRARRQLSQKTREKRALAELGLQRCSRCREIKPFTDEYFVANGERGLSGRCHECNRENTHMYYQRKRAAVAAGER